MRKIICSICGKEITINQGVAVFTDETREKYTHVMSDGGYDCDYVYMMEVCNPIYHSNINEILDLRKEQF